MKSFEKHLIKEDATILQALDILNTIGQTLTLFVLDKDDRLVGTLTDGDVRRGFLRGLTLNTTVDQFMSKQFSSLNLNYASIHEIKKIKEKGIQLLPILSKDGKIHKVIDFNKTKSLLPIDAVIMAGGRGERLKPLTDNLPKPLLKIGALSILEQNLLLLANYGIENIYITTRYLGKQIIDQIGDGKEKGISIHYIEEKFPMGTIGSVRQIKEFSNDSCLVMNADLFTNINIEEFFSHFSDSAADMSIASVPQNFSLPYAVLGLSNEEVKSFSEKPTYTYYVNAGIYLMKKEILEFIPEDSFFDATDLIASLLQHNKKIIYFPIIGFWIDIGKHEDLIKAQEFIKYL